MSIKTQLCNIVITMKNEQNLTYDDIIDSCQGSLHKSQLTNILKNEGCSVGLSKIEQLITNLGGKVEVCLRTDYDF